MTAALEGCEWSAARPGHTLPPGKTRYPLYRRLGGPQDQSGRAENLVSTGIRSWTYTKAALWILLQWPICFKKFPPFIEKCFSLWFSKELPTVVKKLKPTTFRHPSPVYRPNCETHNLPSNFKSSTTFCMNLRELQLPLVFCDSYFTWELYKCVLHKYRNKKSVGLVVANKEVGLEVSSYVTYHCPVSFVYIFRCDI